MTFIARLKALYERTMSTVLGQAWLVFTRSNGGLLTAGVSYNLLFALFAMLFIAFVGVGFWLGASNAALDGLITLLNNAMPGLIGDPGVFSPDQVREIARDSAGVLGFTGAVAVVVAVWTATGAVTVTRQAMRNIFDLGFDERPFWMLLLRDFATAVVLGLGLLFSAALSVFANTTIGDWLGALGWSASGPVAAGVTRAVTIVVVWAVNVALLTFAIRFLTSPQIAIRGIVPGAALGAIALTVLQLGAGFLLSRAGANPLFASFAVIIGLLLWCRWLSMAVLLTASGVAVATGVRAKIDPSVTSSVSATD